MNDTAQPTPDEYEVLAVGYQALSGKAYHMSDCATSCAPAEKPSPCDCKAPQQSDALRKALERIEAATRNEIRAGDKGYISRYGIQGIARAALEARGLEIRSKSDG